jgi:hypothetical protein
MYDSGSPLFPIQIPGNTNFNSARKGIQLKISLSGERGFGGES